MNRKLEEKLVKAFPYLYFHYRKPQTGLAYGFDIPDEWFGALWLMSEDLKKIGNVRAWQLKVKWDRFDFYYFADESNFELVRLVVNEWTARIETIPYD